MSAEPKQASVTMRKEPFAQRSATAIWCEEPSPQNPYLAARARCHGYDLYELMAKRSFVDVFYLLFRGELPDLPQAELLQTLMVALINPGPRHPAVRAAMNAGVGKTNPLHILPIASALLGGEIMGGAEVERAMLFLVKARGTDVVAAAKSALLRARHNPDAEQAESLVPGFGRRCGGMDPMAAQIAQQLLALAGAGPALKWGAKLAANLAPQGAGWLSAGVAAAVFTDLGFSPRAGGCLFQLLCAPGVVAQGLEMAQQPITAMPFISDENYVIER